MLNGEATGRSKMPLFIQYRIYYLCTNRSSIRRAFHGNGRQH
jgi:hypothetical protein